MNPADYLAPSQRFEAAGRSRRSDMNSGGPFSRAKRGLVTSLAGRGQYLKFDRLIGASGSPAGGVRKRAQLARECRGSLGLPRRAEMNAGRATCVAEPRARHSGIFQAASPRLYPLRRKTRNSPAKYKVLPLGGTISFCVLTIR